VTNENHRREESNMKARMKNPVAVVPEAFQALLALGASAREGGVPQRTLDLVYLRASQINGCGVCLDMHARDLKKAGETDERLFTVAAWRETPWFTDAERAALALAEAATRLSDRADPVPDSIWEEAARHYDERGLADLVLHIALINSWNRINVSTRQVADSSRDAQREDVNAPARRARAPSAPDKAGSA
jgi:AhpD family alkylhydroperoxidase